MLLCIRRLEKGNFDSNKTVVASVDRSKARLIRSFCSGLGVIIISLCKVKIRKATC